MQKGDIIYHKKLIFNDKTQDNKKYRPCVVIFIEDKVDGKYIYSVPLTSQVKTFNKKPKYYCLMPEIIYNYKKLSFANITGVTCNKIDNVCETGLKVDETTMEVIIRKIENIKVKGEQKELYEHIKKILIYINLFDEIEKREQNREKKLKKAEKRRNSKQMSKKLLTNNE